MQRYRKEVDYYDQAARLGAQVLESQFQAAGIRAIVTSRAKSPLRLDSKVRQRRPADGYRDADAIFDDIVDLAGIRVALYFPLQRDQVDTIIRQLFFVHKEKSFPDSGTPPKYQKRFSGYSAMHYRVTLQDKAVGEAQRRYCEARIEIQVASILMHAWSEVEHDLVYKPMQGALSKEEYAILDELNGLVMAGEIALERLQSSGDARVSAGGRKFANHYELAAYLLGKADVQSGMALQQGLGPADTLFELLATLGLDTPDLLGPYLLVLHSDFERRPIAMQIIDQILSENESRYQVFERLRLSREPSKIDSVSPSEAARDQALGFFMQRWIDYERTVRGLMSHRGERGGPPVLAPGHLEQAGIIDHAVRLRLEPIRSLRNKVVHGLFEGQPDELEENGRLLAEITRELEGRNGDLR